MLKGRILIVDDEGKLRSLFGRIIKTEGFDVIEAGDCKTGLNKLDAGDIDVVLCDVKLPDGNGVDLVKKIKELFPLIEVILLTAYGNIPDGVRAIQNGAFDYITKGDDNEKLIPLIYRAAEKVQLQKRINRLERRVGEKYSFDNILGRSKQIQEVVSLAKKVSATDANVLLLGETGTGKEVFAQSIHAEGKRRFKPFVAVNCSAFSKELLESELFGHVAGAFTGAIKDKKGLFEEADGGTIFLDEIGDMPLELQVKLLRILESGEFIKVGDTKTLKVDVRIIAATNRNLKKEIEEGKFREDLYYRLCVFQIMLPALRERIKDIDQFVEFFAQQYSEKIYKRKIDIGKDYIEKLKSHTWKGNIREMKNVIERSVILSDGNMLTASLLPFEIQQVVKNDGTLSAFAMSSVEKLHIQKVLNYTKGNKAEAARLLEIGIATLYRKMEEYHLN